MARYGLDYAASRPSTRAWCTAASPVLARRPLCAARRLRLRHPGHGRPDERDRRARRLGRRPAKSGRGRGRSVHRHVRHGGHSGRAAPCRAHGRRPAGRHGAARHASRHAGQPGRQLPGQRQGTGRMGNAHQNIVPYQVFEVAPAADGRARTTSSWRWATTASTPSSAPWPVGPTWPPTRAL
jgi:hypothetical protein